MDKKVSLTPQLQRIIIDKATEYPHSGQYNQWLGSGTYLCRRCGLALFRATAQFNSGCGWPSFDQAIAGTVKQVADADGQRMEIVCHRCQAHLGHVFQGESFTAKNLRHCVNSAALDWVANDTVLDSEEALVAGGCFWGVDYYLKQLPGVLKIEVGYMGGHSLNPDYHQVCTGNTGHYETVRVLFDPKQISYQDVLKRFFELHDPTQKNGQGPDLGPQYQSAIFYYDPKQQADAAFLSQKLIDQGYAVATLLLEAQIFWPAESYHQDYYAQGDKQPYCHRLVKRFT